MVATMPRSSSLPAGGLPPFLFRTASSNRSRGINTSEVMDPLAGYNSSYHDSVAVMPEVPRLLYDHISYQYKTPSEFTSWSISLLYVLIHANRKAHYLTEANVQIYCMDTRNLLDPSRLYSATELLKKNRVASKDDALEQYAQGEFLIHGKLENTDGKVWHTVEFDDLMDAGLWNCFWAFQKDLEYPEKLRPLFPQVMRLRGGWFKEVAQLPESAVAMLRKLSGAFGEEWEGAVMVALICMRKRTLDAEGVKAIQKAVDGIRLPELNWGGDTKLRMWHLSVEVRKCPETMQMVQVLRMLHDREMKHLAA